MSFYLRLDTVRDEPTTNSLKIMELEYNCFVVLRIVTSAYPSHPNWENNLGQMTVSRKPWRLSEPIKILTVTLHRH